MQVWSKFFLSLVMKSMSPDFFNFFFFQAIQNQSELDSLNKKLDFLVDENEKLER